MEKALRTEFLQRLVGKNMLEVNVLGMSLAHIHYTRVRIRPDHHAEGLFAVANEAHPAHGNTRNDPIVWINCRT